MAQRTSVGRSDLFEERPLRQNVLSDVELAVHHRESAHRTLPSEDHELELDQRNRVPARMQEDGFGHRKIKGPTFAAARLPPTLDQRLEMLGNNTPGALPGLLLSDSGFGALGRSAVELQQRSEAAVQMGPLQAAYA